MQYSPQPHEILDQMSTCFLSKSNDLFNYSNTGFYEFEKGKYKYAIIKPSKRLARAVSSDKEILCLFINFEQLQVRTIAAVRKLIERFGERLDKKLSIVVHKSDEGNESLKNWGRESGLRILPIYYSPSFEHDDSDIETALRFELFSHDPFDITGPVSNDEHFFGRKTEAQDLARKLQTGTIRSLMGIRKTGKTSILNRIMQECQNEYDCHCIMMDCSRDDIWASSASGLMASIVSSIENSIHNNLKYLNFVTTKSTPNIGESVSNACAVLEQSTKPVILFIDEFDYITPSSPTSTHWTSDFNTFWRNFRVIYQESSRNNAKLSLMISGVSSKWFYTESIDNVENAALALIPEEYLAPLQKGAATAMIKKLGRISGLTFSDETCTLISDAAACIPYWIRKMCSYINTQIDISRRPHDISPQETKDIIKEFIISDGSAIAKLALIHAFRVYPEISKSFDMCYKNNSKSLTDAELRTLRNYGLLTTRKNMLNGAMLEHGYNLIKSETSAQTELTSKSASLGQLELTEWAEEIAAISKRRNILEKQLRNLVVYFIKFDSVTNKKESTRDRILSIIPSSERAKLSHLQAEVISEKLTWLQLCMLIEKEWGIFERIFGSKDIFKQSIAIINDRPDAHAKTADAADFALYRRHLTILEDCIKKTS